MALKIILSQQDDQFELNGVVIRKSQVRAILRMKEGFGVDAEGQTNVISIVFVVYNLYRDLEPKDFGLSDAKALVDVVLSVEWKD